MWLPFLVTAQSLTTFFLALLFVSPHRWSSSYSGEKLHSQGSSIGQ
jgi:hypothetical protein